jgi:hypothetical protein
VISMVQPVYQLSGLTQGWIITDPHLVYYGVV